MITTEQTERFILFVKNRNPGIDLDHGVISKEHKNDTELVRLILEEWQAFQIENTKEGMKNVA